MSLEKTQIARPTAAVVFGGSAGAVSPEHIRITAQINSFPRVDVRFHDIGEPNKSRSVVPEDLAAKIAADQTSMFEAAASASVSMEDGLGGTISFKGFQTNTSYELIYGGVGYSAAAIHTSAIVDTLQTSLYKYGNLTFREIAPLITGDSTYSSWMTAALDHILERWDATALKTDNLDAISKAFAQRAHTNNEKGLAAWREILKASKDINEHLPSIKTSALFSGDLVTAIIGIYLNSYGSFLQTIQQFGLQFQLIYVPDMGSGYGKFICAKDTIQQELTKKVHIMRMQLSAGAKSAIPVTQVSVNGLPGNSWRDDNLNRSKFLPAPSISMFPPTVTSGRVYAVNFPGWLRLSAAEPEKESKEEGSGPPDPAAYADKRILQDVKFRETIDTTVLKIADEWAKNVYVDMALADSTAQITVPLDLTWELGKTYKVTTEGAKGQKNKNLFTGFLAGFSHNLSSSQVSPQAYTSLMFTHVQGEGFTLPGLE